MLVEKDTAYKLFRKITPLSTVQNFYTDLNLTQKIANQDMQQTSNIKIYLCNRDWKHHCIVTPFSMIFT